MKWESDVSHWTDELKYNKIHHLEEKDFTENPDTVKWSHVSKTAATNPINMRNYQNVGGVTHNDNVEQVIEKMINDQGAARGIKIDQKEVKKEDVPIGFDGIKDDRKDCKFFKIYPGK